jgi:Sulfotransferase family
MVLSLSELFSGLRDKDLSERELSGAEFWDMLSRPSPIDVAGLRCHIELEEMLYPVFSPRSGAERFGWDASLPPLMQACLPHLTDRPDHLYAMLEAVTVKQPRRLFSEHLWWLFDVLADGRCPAMVVERSGGSLAYAAMLMRLFPQARVVHLFRDGRECAVSMSRHARYKLAMIRAAMNAQFGWDPYAPEIADLEAGRLAPEVPEGFASDEGLAGLAPDRITRARYDEFEVPLYRYGVMWSKMIASGLPELPDEPRLLRLDYANMVARPEENIGRFLDFLGLERDPMLEKRMAAKIKPNRDVRGEVGEQVWNELTIACRLGMNRLYGRSGWT